MFATLNDLMVFARNRFFTPPSKNRFLRFCYPGKHRNFILVIFYKNMQQCLSKNMFVTGFSKNRLVPGFSINMLVTGFFKNMLVSGFSTNMLVTDFFKNMLVIAFF